MQPADIARLIDHTLLRPDATEAMLHATCSEAIQHRFWSVCINPLRVPLVAEALRGSEVRVCSVVGFPFGASPPRAKAFEAELAVASGAAEIDMVINIGALKDGDHDTVLGDIAAVRTACPGAVLKVIIETCLLEDAEKAAACCIAAEAGADFVKTSTGYAGSGATLADVTLMRQVVPALGVKASGGVRDYKAARAMVEAGASRIGTSSGVSIVTARTAQASAY